MPALLITLVGSIIGLGAASLSFDLGPLGNWLKAAFLWCRDVIVKLLLTIVLVLDDWISYAFDVLLDVVVYVLGGVCTVCGVDGFNPVIATLAEVLKMLPDALIGLLVALGFMPSLSINVIMAK